MQLHRCRRQQEQTCYEILQIVGEPISLRRTILGSAGSPASNSMRFVQDHHVPRNLDNLLSPLRVTCKGKRADDVDTSSERIDSALPEVLCRRAGQDFELFVELRAQ